VMGAVYARFKHGKAKPRVGLLSNGTEASKGTELTRTVHGLLSEHDWGETGTYAGYVEGGALYSGEVDVVVTDGFSGNVALKIAEATGRLIAGWLKDAIRGAGVAGQLGGLLIRGPIRGLAGQLDPDRYGAAPLLGVQGVAFICHGAASAVAVEQALLLATRSVDEALTPKLSAALADAAPLFAEAKAAAAKNR
ncbi:MAG: phosphate--acyl-ACP acyltransferase, partial [Myxococcota bacterium]